MPATATLLVRSSACFRPQMTGRSDNMHWSPNLPLSHSPHPPLCLLFLSLLLSCHSNPKKVIGVVPKATSHLFWVSVQAGAMTAGHDLGVEVQWNGPATETDYSRQIEIVDSMIARHVDGLALAAQDHTALDASLDRAAKA